jgi:hypothetical protein
MSEDFNTEAFQRRIKQMSDSELIRQGKTAAEFAKMGLPDFHPSKSTCGN